MPLAVFPKCFLDALCVTRSMSVTQWLDLAASLPVDGVELYSGFLNPADPEKLDSIHRQIRERRLAMPMLCYSPDFTKPDASARAEEVDRQRAWIKATARLGGRYCRVLSGQRRPEVSRADGISYTVECIRMLLPDAER